MNSSHGQLKASVRSRGGKGVARRLRRAGQIPAVLYGRGAESGELPAPLPLALSPAELRRALDPRRKLNTFLQLTVQETGRPDRQIPCVISDVQLDPVRDDFVHVDFLRVDPEKPVTVEIPVEYTGRAAGVVTGGELRALRRTVRVAARPAEIPVCLSVDVSPLEMGQALRLRDVPLAGARVVEDLDTVVALVGLPRKVVEEPKPEVAAAAPAAAAAAPPTPETAA